MRTQLSRRQLIAGAAAASAALVVQTAAPVTAAPLPESAATSSGGAASAASRAATTAVRYAPFPLGYSAGSFTAFQSQAVIAKTLDTIVSSGGTTVRFDIMWVIAQPTATTWSWDIFDYMVTQSLARGLSILGVIVSSPPWAALNGGGNTTRPKTAALYATFAGVVAKRYKGKIAAYEIWNEPNGRTYFAPDPDPVFYAQMVKAASAKIKAADPAATVLAGAVGPAPDADGLINPVAFVTKMYAAGAGGSFDALSYHLYDYVNTLAAGSLWNNTAARRTIELHAVMKANGDGLKKIWLSETGLPTGGSITQSLQASRLSSTLQSWGEVSYAGPVYIFTVTDNSSETFGVVTSAFAAKKSLATITNLQSAGLPLTTRGKSFKSHADAALGATVSVSYPMGSGAVQECENGSRYQTPYGWFSSPVAVATLARLYQFVPKTAFANDYQDFDLDGGMRIFYKPATGAHAVVGAILAAWQPSLGVATTDEYAYPSNDNSRANDFEFGRIVWSPVTGVKVTTF